jgi:2'-5' RNA ligase
MSRKRLFFALWPDDRQRDRLHDCISPLEELIDGRHVYRGNWHVTTAFIGDFAEGLIPDLQARAAAIPAEPFRLRFDRVEFWPRPRVACLIAPTTPPELDRLVASLNNLLLDFGVQVEDRRYRPHITIARRAKRFEALRLAQPALTEWSGFALIESISQPGGVVYRPVKQ